MSSASSFANFWPEYVHAHSQPGTRAIHLAGTLAGWMLFLSAVVLQRWRWVAAALVVPYAPAWIFPLFCGAQPAGEVRTSGVVVAGGSENGGSDADAKNERRSPPLHHRAKLESRTQN